MERRANTAGAQNCGAGGKIRPVHHLQDVINGEIGIVEIEAARIDHFAQIMRRDIGGHANRDTAGTIDQKVRVLCR